MAGVPLNQPGEIASPPYAADWLAFHGEWLAGVTVELLAAVMLEAAGDFQSAHPVAYPVCVSGPDECLDPLVDHV